MIGTLLEESCTIWDFFPSWRHPVHVTELFGDNANKHDPAIYAIGYKNSKIAWIRVPTDGTGCEFEATTHETAHMVDFAMRGQVDRVLKQNYDMPFDRRPENLLRAFKRELSVIAIQWRLFLMCGAREVEALETIHFLFGGIYALNVFENFRTNIDLLRYTRKQFEKLTEESIAEAYELVLQTIDKNCLKSKRRSV